MPRAKRVVEETTETEAAPVARRGRRKAAAAAEPEAAPVVRRGRRKAATAEVEEAPAKEKSNGVGRAKQELLYVERNKAVWGELEEGRDSKVVLADGAAPRGRVQNMVADFMGERGRKKTTAEDVITYLDEEEVNGGVNIVSHLINIGMLEIA